MTSFAFSPIKTLSMLTATSTSATAELPFEVYDGVRMNAVSLRIYPSKGNTDDIWISFSEDEADEVVIPTANNPANITPFCAGVIEVISVSPLAKYMHFISSGGPNTFYVTLGDGI